MDNRFSHIRVALDGPSGAGKSTIAKEVAKIFILSVRVHIAIPIPMKINIAKNSVM